MNVRKCLTGKGKKLFGRAPDAIKHERNFGGMFASIKNPWQYTAIKEIIVFHLIGATRNGTVEIWKVPERTAGTESKKAPFLGAEAESAGKKERNIGVARGNPCFLRHCIGHPPRATLPLRRSGPEQTDSQAQTERTFRNKRQTNVAAFPTIAC